MKQIKQITGTITKVDDLSPTAREYTITPHEPLSFIAGAFINLFVEHNGKTIRRAFSISSSDQYHDTFTLSIRLNPQGELTPLLWDMDLTDTTVKIMGPLGLNTADKMQSKRVFLFGFGVGAGVVKSLTDHVASRYDIESLTVMTGNRSVEEILHKDYFDQIVEENKKVTVNYVVSDKNQTKYRSGYIQDHVAGYDFSNADIYMCGQGIACTTLETTIRASDPVNCNFFVEDFH